MFQIESVPPVDGIGLTDEPEVSIEYSKDKQSSSNQESGVLVVKFVMKVRHFVGILLRVVLMGRIEDEPFADFKHGSQKVHILLVR